MTEEEIIQKKLDRLNQNSHYGIMIDTEITKIVRSHIKRLEEATMHADCEFCVKRDICTRDVPKPCTYRYTEEERIADQASDMFGNILHKTYLHPTFRKKKEETKMNATSTEVLKDIIAIDFELQTFPDPDTQDKFIVSATNRDDIFCFVFEGPKLVDACRKAGLLNGWEKDQRIKELEKDNKQLEKEYEKKLDDIQRKYERALRGKQQLKDELKKELERVIKERNEFQNKYNLEKAANEAQHKFFVNYAGRGTEIEFNYAIDDTDEVTYVIVDKKTYDEEPNINIHGMDFTLDELVNKVLELEEENNRLKDTSKEGDYVCLNGAYDTNDIKKLKERINKLYGQHSHNKEHEEKPSDNVNHPSHYTGKYECIDVMQDVFGNEATDNFCLCNAFKYIWRARKKNGLEDVKKAVWYLNKYIEEAEKDGKDKVTGA